MNYTDIMARLEAIKALAITELDKRQPLLVALLADIVNGEASDGNDTVGSDGLEYQDWWNTLHHLTKDAGFKLLGNGHFSAAYAHDMLPGRVIKVGFKKEDSGAAYVAFCRMHQGKAGIPNIYHVERHAGCYTVVLDKLVSCDRDLCNHEAYADIARYFIESDSADKWDYDESDHAFIETCQDIRKFFKGIASFDMHSGNIMFSEDGTPYITDPVSFSHDREREQGFPLDPEALLADIEAAANEAMIERCRNRKAKCNPQGTFWINRKAGMKRRKRNRKAREANRKEMEAIFARNRMAHAELRREEVRGQDFLGEHVWHNMWLHNEHRDVMAIDKMNAAKWVLADHFHIQAGRSLLIDKLLDARFQG